MEFRLLGRLEVESAGVDLTPARPKQVTALGLLLLHAGEVVSSDELVDALWGERPPETAQTALQGHVSALRKRLGAERIETHPPGYLLRLQPNDELDVRRFEHLVAEAATVGPLVRAEQLREALSLFRGYPFADFAYDSFARGESQRVEELRLAAGEALIDAELQLGRHAEVLPELERLVVLHPHRERLRGQLMVALYRAGRQAESLAVFSEGRRVLVEELGVEPSLTLRQLERRILNQDVELAAPDVFAPAPHRAGAEPSGLVTFLLAQGIRDDDLARTVVGQHGGVEVDVRTQSLLASFARARDAAGAAVGLERATRGVVRIGIHSVEATMGGGARTAASICAAAHGGQIVCSQTTRDLLRESPLDDAAIRDLGEHRLSDLAPAQRLFQLFAPDLAGEFPPPLGLDRRTTNLPSQTTPLIGREHELKELADLLVDPSTRIVTLTGPGGTGKTRLATHVAADLLDEFTDGVFFVALAGLADPQLVLPTIARTLGVGETASGPVAVELERRMRGRRMLLVLDNAEHLPAAAAVIDELAGVAAGLRLVVTSRVPLRLSSETTYAVTPLPEPAGVALFNVCAHIARPDFAVTPETVGVVAGICATLDGLPLAIELAAARITVMSPVTLLERLDQRLRLLKRRSPDLPARHLSLRAAIDWSYNLLGPAEQKLFARLAVFLDGCTLDAVESVCDDDPDVIDQLSSLVDANLIAVRGTDQEPRFAMLETIREYAADLLRASSESGELGRRHTAYFLSLAEDAEPHLRESPGRWLERLEQEHNNLRAALDRVSAAGEIETATQLSGALWRFWYLKGHLTEGRRRLEDAVTNDVRPTPARARALIGAAVLAFNCGDSVFAIRWAEEGIAASGVLGDVWGVAYAGFMLGNALESTDPPRAQQLLEESAQRFRELGDSHSMLLVTRRLATIADGHDPQQARALHEDNLRVARETTNPRIEASTLGALSRFAVDEGRLDDAVEMLSDSLRLHQGLGDLLDTAVDLCHSAALLSNVRKPTVAAEILASFEGFRDEVGVRGPFLAEMNRETLTSIHAQIDEAAFTEAWERGRPLTSDEALALALAELS